VVIPSGCWRADRKLTSGACGSCRCGGRGASVFDSRESARDDTRGTRTRAEARTRAPLLYVTLTPRARVLVLPWDADLRRWARGVCVIVGRGRWKMSERRCGNRAGQRAAAKQTDGDQREGAEIFRTGGNPVPQFCRDGCAAPTGDRADAARARERVGLDEPPPGGARGSARLRKWWHETMEFLPGRTATPRCRRTANARCARRPEQGSARAPRKSGARLRASAAWANCGRPAGRGLRSWASCAVCAPDAWVDGVIDLVLHDAAAAHGVDRRLETNSRRPRRREGALLARLAPSMRLSSWPMGACVAQFFPAQRCALVFQRCAGLSATRGGGINSSWQQHGGPAHVALSANTLSPWAT